MQVRATCIYVSAMTGDANLESRFYCVSMFLTLCPNVLLLGYFFFWTDYHKPRDWSTFPPKDGELVCAAPARLRELYRKQRSEPGYRRIVESNVTIFGTFDGEFTLFGRSKLQR